LHRTEARLIYIYGWMKHVFIVDLHDTLSVKRCHDR